MDRLPLTANGKVDRAALAALDAAGPGVAGQPRETEVGDAPDGPLELRLARICSAVLGVERFTATDNFFDLGGTSLALLRLHSAIRRELGDGVPLLALYQNPSVRALARSLSGAVATIAPAGQPRGSAQAERSRRLAARRNVR